RPSRSCPGWRGRRSPCCSTGPWCTAWPARRTARTSPAASPITPGTRRSRPGTPRRPPTPGNGRRSGTPTCPATKPRTRRRSGERHASRGLRGGLRRGVARRRRDPGQPDGADPVARRPAGPAHVRAGPAAHRRRGYLVDASGEIEGWMPYREVFTMLAAGRRHVMMGGAQIDRHGNQNISAIGDWKRPKAQLLGVRGAPGNTVNHPVSYWIPKHSPRVFTPRVDMVSGVGYDRGARELRVVVTNLAVLDFGGLDFGGLDFGGLDFQGTAERVMRLRSVHPGVEVSE